MLPIKGSIVSNIESVFELNKILEEEKTDLIILNKSIYTQEEVMYLIEPSYIRLTKALKKNANTLVELKDANVVLNMSFVNNQELPDFEYETKLTVFDNIPPLNDRNENSIEINNFLRKLGYNIVDNINNQ